MTDLQKSPIDVRAQRIIIDIQGDRGRDVYQAASPWVRDDADQIKQARARALYWRNCLGRLALRYATLESGIRDMIDKAQEDPPQAEIVIEAPYQKVEISRG